MTALLRRTLQLDSGTVLRILVFVAIFSLAALPPVDPDLWWHLANGRLILASGWPHADVYSFTAQGQPWIVHEWLTDVGMQVLAAAAGLPLLVSVFAALVTLAAGCAYWLMRRAGLHSTVAAVLTVIGALAGSPSWGARPQVLNVVLFALLACGLVRFRDGKLPAWWLAPLLWLWANLHSGFLSGVVLIGLCLAGDTFQVLRAGAPRRWDQLRRLALAAAAGLGLAFVNPYGWDTVLFPLGTLSSSLIQNNIQEWASPDFHSLAGHLLEVMLFVILAGVGTRRVRAPLTEWLWMLAFLGLALSSQRQVPLFVVAAAPLIGRSAQALLEAAGEVLPRAAAHPGERAAIVATPLGPAPTRALVMVNAVLLVVVGVGMVAYRAVPNLLPDREAAAIASVFPVGGADALQAVGHPLHVLNYYDYGGYLVYRLWPSGTRVFIDGRVEVYGPRVFSDYLAVSYASPQWREVIARYRPDAIILPSGHPLVTLLAADPQWQTLRRDSLATVFLARQGSQ